MPKKKTQDSFDVIGTPYSHGIDRAAAIKQAASEIKSASPAHGFSCQLSGTRMVLSIHLVETYLDDPSRRDSVLEECEKSIKKYLSELRKRIKKEFKDFKATEIKQLRTYDLERISLNNVWKLVYKSAFELGELGK
jgi:hypothetical protein